MTVVGVISVLNTEHEACSVIGSASLLGTHLCACVAVCARARVQNKCNSFSRFVFVLAENRKAGGVREEVEGGTGALMVLHVELDSIFYFILLKKRKENNNKNANTLISGRILCHGSSKPLKGVSARPHVLLLPDPSSV